MDKDRKRILILEDNPSDAELEVSHINELDLNLELVVCTNRKDYEQTLETFTPDVVLSDYNLPSYTGEDALLYLRQKDPDELIPFVLVTGVIGVTDATKMMKIGVFDLVEKDNLGVLDSVLQRALLVSQERKEAHKQAELLKKIGAISKTGGWEMNLVTNELTWNSVTKKIHEVAEDYVPKFDSATQFFKEGWSRQLLEQCVTECAETGTPYDVEVILVTAKGNERWVRALGEAESKDGEITRLFGVIQDLDNQTRLRKERESMAERHKAVLDATHSAAWEWDMTTNRVYVDENFIKLAGASHLADEIDVLSDKRGLYVSIDTLRSIILPEDLPGFLEKLAAHFQGDNEIFESEYRVYETEERTVWIYSRGKVVERDKEQTPIKMVGSLTDVSSLHSLSKEILEKDLMISSIADNLNGALYRYALYPSGKDRVLYLNKGAEEFFGVSLDEAKMRARLLFERIHPDDIKEVLAAVQRAAQNLLPLSVTFRLRYGSGAYRWIKNTAVPNRLKDKTVLWDGFTMDITEQIESSQNFETVFELSPIAKIIFNIETGRIVNVNEEASRLYGYTAKEFLALNASEIQKRRISNTDFKEIIQQIVSGEKKHAFKAKHVKKDGTEFIVEADASTIRYHDSDCIIATFQDRTEEIQQKEKLRKLSLVADKSTNGVIITNQDQEIEWVNEGFERLSGYTLEEVKGKNARLLQGKDTREKDRAMLREGIKYQSATYTEILNYTKDGVPYWVEIFLTPVKNEKGDVVNFVAIENDISNRRRREEELIESRMQTEAALHELELRNLALDQHSIVAITDTKGIIQYANDLFADTSKYSKEELVGSTHRLISSGYHDEEFWKSMYHTIGAGEVWHGVIRNRKKDGSLYWLRTTITPFTDAETGKVVRYIAIRTDITARVEAENKLRKTLDNLEDLVRVKTEKLESAHKSVLESLQYAQRLQQALVPTNSELKSVVSNAGALLMPKDIVSGDFYWLHEAEDNLIVALVDCTGHGVPGAMMSMLANELLNSVVIQKQIYRPDVVLEELDGMVAEQLMRQDAKLQMADGMDMSVVTIDRDNGLFSYSGAKSHGLYYHKHTGEFEALRPDRYSIGGTTVGVIKDFTRLRFDFEPGDRFYLFSDGICDQFGGTDSKKFMRKRLVQLIEESKDLAVDKQVELIEKELKLWMGDTPQLDDISFLAMEI